MNNFTHLKKPNPKERMERLNTIAKEFMKREETYDTWTRYGVRVDIMLAKAENVESDFELNLL